MAKPFRIPFFSGVVPRAGRRELQDSQAQVAQNAKLLSGELRALNDTLLINSPGLSGLLSTYKMTQAGVDYWLAWATDVDAAKGPIAGDTTNRTYYTGAGEPRVTNFAMATATSAPYPNTWYVLGVTPPTTAASVSHAGGTGVSVDRAFKYTFVTQWGEESAPSPASTIVTGKVDGTWTVASMDAAPGNTYAISAAAWAGGVLTLTVASTFGLRVGETVTLSGLAPAALNATFVVATVPGTTSFTVPLTADPTPITGGVGTATRVAPHNTTSMTKNIYWTETSGSGTIYQLVKSSVAVATTSTTVAGNTTPTDQILTTTWAMPPVDLAGMVFHPSGCAVGFSKNQLVLSEPYAPYAYPTEFRYTVDYDIVGVAIFGTSIFVGTKGNPYIATGTDPVAMTLTKIDQPWPCVAKKSLLTMGYGVLYAAPQGLAFIGLMGAELFTKDLYTIEGWTLLVPSTFRAAPYSGRYVVSYDPGDGAGRRLLIVDKGEFASVTTSSVSADALYGDQKTGYLYILLSNKIYQWDSSSAQRLSYDWMSKEFFTPDRVNWGAAKVDADFTGLTAAESAAIAAAATAATVANQATINALTWDFDGGTSAVGEIEVGGVSFAPAPPDTSNRLQFQLWIDNQVKFTKVVTSSAAFTLPSGYKSDAVSVRLTGNVKVLAVVVGETMIGLRSG